MKKNLTIIVLTFLLVACNKYEGELTGLGIDDAFREAQPYGMVFIKRGSFMMGPNDQSALISSVNDKQLNVSVDAFWMDETEITNDKYKQFVFWVRDSIALRLLVMAGKDEYRMKLKDQEDTNPETARLNWKARSPWGSKEEDVKAILETFYYEGGNSMGVRKQSNPGKLQYKYKWINYDQAALRGNKYDVNTGAYPPNAKVRVDTSFVDENGIIINKTLERRLTTRKDLISTRIVNIYPDTMMWIRDFQYAYNDPKMRMYFSHPAYSRYPVVGVTWEQAQAFCQWRTQLFNNVNRIGGQEYRLPTEAEWEYAARGGRRMALYPWGGNYIRDAKGCYLANFKPMRGSYTDDTGSTTLMVASFAPNNFGLFDMSGNVAEWTSSAYNVLNSTLISDMNPSFQYNAKNSDPDALKRKIIKGGSWKDIAHYLQCGVKTYEYQNESRPYIGFRCVRSYNGE